MILNGHHLEFEKQSQRHESMKHIIAMFRERKLSDEEIDMIVECQKYFDDIEKWTLFVAMMNSATDHGTQDHHTIKNLIGFHAKTDVRHLANIAQSILLLYEKYKLSPNVPVLLDFPKEAK